MERLKKKTGYIKFTTKHHDFMYTDISRKVVGKKDKSARDMMKKYSNQQ